MQSVALLGVFLEAISHGSWKTSSTPLQFNLLPFIRCRLDIKFIVLSILLKFLSKRRERETKTKQIMHVYAQLVKPYQTYFFYTANSLKLSCLKHLISTCKIDKTRAHLITGCRL